MQHQDLYIQLCSSLAANLPNCASLFVKWTRCCINPIGLRGLNESVHRKFLVHSKCLVTVSYCDPRYLVEVGFKAMILSQEWFPPPIPQGTFGKVQFWFLIWGEALRTSSGEWPGMLLNIPQCRGQPPATENFPAANGSSVQVEKPGCKGMCMLYCHRWTGDLTFKSHS